MELDTGDEIQASAFGFAQASLDQTTDVAFGTPAVTIFDLASENAFVGFGSFVGADEGVGDVIATADTYNLYGTASSPSFSGSVDKGGSSASVITDENGVFQRSNAASADSITGTNTPVGVSHNQMGGVLAQEGAIWWTGFMLPVEPAGGDLMYDHLTGAFMGGGGN